MSSAPQPPRRSRIPRVQNFEYDDAGGVSVSVSRSPSQMLDGQGAGVAATAPTVARNPEAVKLAQLRARREREADLPVFKSGVELLTQDPDMVISEHTTVKGDLTFENLLRIDGTVQGSIKAPKGAGLIVGERGTLVGNVLGLGCMLIEGRVIGNVNVESLHLCETGVVHGDIAARSVDIRHDATFVGQLHISAFDPIAVVSPETGKIDSTRKHGRFLLSEDTAEEIRADAKAKKKKARKAARKAAKEAGEELPPSDNDDDDTDGETDDDTPSAPQKNKRTTLLLLDPQQDFHGTGSCAVSGADEDAERIAEFIYTNMGTIDEIIITLDSHHRMHIAHAIFWCDDQGVEPPLYTVITLQDVESGRWLPKDVSLVSHCKFYLGELQKKGRYGQNYLVIKPEHCLIGTKGHAVQRSINDAVQDWAVTRMRKVTYVFKGTNCLVDMTSALMADVEILEDPTTSYDPDLVTRLNNSHHLIVGGQSLSHTVNFTMRDLLTHWQGSRGNISLLRDCCSNDASLASAYLSGPTQVPSFDAGKFFSEMEGAGVNVAYAAEVMLKKPQPQGSGS